MSSLKQDNISVSLKLDTGEANARIHQLTTDINELRKPINQPPESKLCLIQAAIIT